MTGLSEVDGNTLEGVSATTLWPGLDRLGFYRRSRPSMTLLEFGP